MKLSEMWKELNNLGTTLDRVEKAVRALSIRPTPTGRVTPFFASEKFVFEKGDFTPQEASLIHSAGRVTRVTRLTYNVNVEVPTLTANLRPQNSFASLSMRPTARGMIRRVPFWLSNTYRALDPALEAASNVFDFEWAMSFGSSERRYAQRRDTQNRNTGGVFMSRNSLGNPENDRSLLFSEKHPITLKTNEFLTFTVRPTFSYLATPGPNSFNTPGFDPIAETGGRFVVSINYAGYRTFGDEVPE